MQVQADGGLHEETEPRLEPIGTLQIHELINYMDSGHQTKMPQRRVGGGRGNQREG